MYVSKNEIKNLQNAANYINIHEIRVGGAFSVFFGIINFFIGMSAIDMDSLNIVLVLLGLFLIVEGVYVLIKPNVAGLILEGLAFSSLGIWNILVTLLNSFHGGESSLGFFFILGIFQLVWGLGYFNKYSHFKGRNIFKPTKEAIEKVNYLADIALKSNPKIDYNSINMKISNSGSSGEWKGLILDEIAFFISVKHRNVYIADRENLNIGQIRKTLLRKNYRMILYLNGKSFFGLIPTEYYDRLYNWKNNIYNSDNNLSLPPQCLNCGTSFSSKVNFCVNCGTNLQNL